ncbi:hypothetical protein [Cellulomonas sp. URHD0024]|uniref:hypothetical protein n=1 Tax=Cellulomonas sp. URHD0024 TaxID=1302620 RepID=UPI00040BED8B|nr:hypothetical protein [Cellulomonas sp. URHD0024]
MTSGNQDQPAAGYPTQPYATQPYATQPYATQPYATQPYATQPYATPVPPQGYLPPDRAFHEAALDAMHRKADRQVLILRWVLIGAAILYILLRSGGESGPVILAVVAVLVPLLIGVTTLVSRSVTGGRHRAVVAARPGVEVIEVWGARGLRAALSAAGVPATKVRKNAATGLSMVLLDQGVELWTGRASNAAVLMLLPWSAVVAVDESRGSITNDGTRAAVMLVTTLGQRLLLVPRSRPEGGRVVKVPQLRAIVGRLEALRLRAVGR